jgi:hypothetical protein
MIRVVESRNGICEYTRLTVDVVALCGNNPITDLMMLIVITRLIALRLVFFI